MKQTLNQPRRNSIGKLLHLLTPVASLLVIHSALAATGTWNADSGGLWSNAGDWSGSVPAAAGDIANLTYVITAPRIITNDAATTVGSLNLGDPGAPYFGYTLTNNGGITFTLNNNGAGAQINQTDGTLGFDLISTPMVLADNLFITNNSILKLAGVISGTGFGITKAGSGTLTNTAADTFTGAVNVSGGMLVFGTGGSINKASSLTINNGGTVQFSGAANGNPIGTANLPIVVNAGGILAVTVANAMGYSGQADYANIALNGGNISLAASQYINTLLLNGGVVSGPGALQWYYTPAAPAVAISCTNTASLASPINFNSVGQTISVSNNATLTISGVIAASGTGVTKVGQGTLTLSGANSYSTPTTINAGTLNLGGGGSLGVGVVTVATNATLLGPGTIGGATTIQAGGTLAIGAPTTGLLTMSSALTLMAGSTNVMKINKTGGVLSSDSIQGLTGVTYGGTLVVSNITSDATALANGDTCQLFASGGYAGGFNGYLLPALPAGLSWDASQLSVGGNLKVVNGVSTPLFNPPAGSYATPQTVTINSLTPGATIYYTTDGSTPSTSSPHGLAPISVTVLTGVPSETLSAFATATGLASSGTASANYVLTTAVWTNKLGGNWSDTGSWLYGFVGNGSGLIADFNALTLSGDTTVTNDVGPTIGSMVFADGGNAHKWIVADIGAGPIELDNGGNTPVITVSNQTATINTVLDDNANGLGLIKNGSGTLNLFGANTYTGTTTANSGTLGIGSVSLSSSSPISIASGATVNSSGTLSLKANGSSTTIGVSGTGTLQMSATTNSVSSPDIYFDANDVDNSTANYGTRIATPVNLGSTQRYIWGKSNHNGVGQYGLTAADCQFAGSISGAGGLTIIAQDAFTGSSPMQVGFCLNAANNFTGPVEVQRGSVYLGAVGAFPSGDVLRFNVASGNTGNFFLYGQNVAVSDLSATNTGTAVIANGNANPSAYGPVTLTVTQNNSAIFAGTIVDVKAEYGVTAGSSNTILSLLKKGTATLTLSGANTYSGTTTVASGKLVLSTGQTTTNAITVGDGAALGVTVAGASQLSPVTLTEGSTNGPATNEFTGLASSSVAPIKAGTLTLKGATTINVLSGNLAPGTIYPLIAYTIIGGTGSFVVGTLPANVVATVITNGSSIGLNVTTGNLLTWNGQVNGTWDISSTANWTLNGAPGKTYLDGSPVLFDDTATGTTSVNNGVTVSPFSITVNNTNRPYTISGNPIAGSASLIKNGANSLTLNGANTFTGNLVIGAGTVTIAGTGVLGGGTYAGSISDNGSLVYDSSTDQTNSGAISGTGTLIQDGSDTLTLAASEPLTGGITVNAGTLRVITDDFGGRFTPSLITVNPNGTLFNDNLHALGQGTILALNGGNWVLNYEDYKTNVTMIDGQINAGPGGDGGSLRWGPSGSAGNSTLLVTNSVAGSVINAPMNLITAGNILAINVGRGAAASDLTINGAIINGGSLVQNGNGILTLTGGNTYTGTTTVNGGTLALEASSSLNSPVTIQSGAKLVIGPTNASQVSISSTLTFTAGSTNLMKIDKTGGTLISDSIQQLTGITYGGTLIVTNITRDATALVSGDTVQLFAATTYAGGFTTFVLPTLPAGLSWDVSQLVNGSIAVVSTVSTPSFNPPGGSYPSVLTVSISSLTPGATIYYTTDGSTPTTSSAHGVTPVTVTVLANSPTNTLTAFGALAGHASSVMNSATYTLSSGIWTNKFGGNWSDAGSWLYAIVANSSGFTADFSTLTLSGDTTVTNDVGPTIGNLAFADRGNAHNWIVADIGAGPIELDNAGNSPVITVSNQTTTINAILDDNSIGLGLTKNGNGTLNLFGANTYTGPTTASAGTLGLSSVTLSSSSPISIASGATVNSFGTLSLNANGSGTTIAVSGAGLLQLSTTTNSASSPDIYFDANDVDNSTANYGTRIGTPVNLGNLQRYIWGKSNHNGVGQYGLTAADCQFAGTISGTGGGLTFIAQDAYTGSSPMEVGFCMNASNSFTGPLEIQRGSVYLGYTNALSQTNVLFMNATTGNNARFFLYGNSISVANLSSSANGVNVIANGNKLAGAELTLGAVTLTVNQNLPGTYSGSIQDVQSEYDGSGLGTTGPLGLTKLGPSMLTLSGVNTYSGTTMIGGGILLVNGSIGVGAVTVTSGGTLGGTGIIGGATTVQSGGNLAPGNNGLGTLTINNTLTLGAASSTSLAINRTAGTANYGNVAGLTTATFGGTLTVTRLGGTFQPGDSFQLFSVGSASNFAATNLPAISPLKWNWNAAAGTLSVASAVNTMPTNVIAVVSGGQFNLSWPTDHIGWRLLMQTNHLATGVSSNTNDWATVAGSSATNQVSIPIDATKPAEFYRLVYP